MSPSPRPSSLLGLAAKYARLRWASTGPLGRGVAVVLAGGMAALPVSYGIHSVRAGSSCCARGARAAGGMPCCAARAARLRASVHRAVNPFTAMCHALGAAREHELPLCRSAAAQAAVVDRVVATVNPRAGSSIAVQPALAWNADRRELGVAYTEAGSEGVSITFARLSLTGERVGTPVRITNPAGENQLDVLPSVSYGANSYLVTWSHYEVASERMDVRGRLVDPDGRPAASTLAISETRLLNVGPRAVFLPAKSGAEAGFGVSWTAVNLDGEGDSLRFVRLSDRGAKQGRERMLRDGAFSMGTAALAPAADGFVTSWSEFDFRTGQSAQVYLRLARDGALQGSAVQIAKGQGIDGSAALSYDGRAHALVWERDVTDSMALSFARVGPSSVEQAPVRVDPAPALAFEPALASIADGPSVLVRTLVSNEGQVGVVVSPIARNGTPGAARRLSPAGVEALMGTVARTQDGFVAAWVDTRRGGIELLAQRVSAAGDPVGNPSPIAR